MKIVIRNDGNIPVLLAKYLFWETISNNLLCHYDNICPPKVTYHRKSRELPKQEPKEEFSQYQIAPSFLKECHIQKVWET